MNEAKYKILEDGTYFGEIPSVQGVWADGITLEACRSELQEVLESWLILKLQHQERIKDLEPATTSIKQAYA